MIHRIGRCAAAALGFILLACGLPARADTAVSLFKSFSGNYNFTGTVETLRSRDNSKPCSVGSSSTTVYAALKGIPSGARIESAQLYWAGSGTSYDYTVNFDGVNVTAPTNRQYSSKYSTNGTTYTYFSGAYDVTEQVKKKGNASYSFSGLSVSSGNPWCAVQGVVGGFALVVVYSSPSEVFRMLNLYEGFQAFRNNYLTINLTGFNVPGAVTSGATGRLGHVTWEGDTTLSQGGEDLLFNGWEMTDSMNPSGNQFNSASNITNDSTTYGIDFDVYTVKDPVIKAGQTSATTTYRSGGDLVLLSTEIAAIPYLPTADLALAMSRNGTLTVGSATDYTLTVSNVGTDTETGPVTVVDTLPSGLKLVSTSGTGWTCKSAAGSNGTTVVTCTASGPVAKGGKLNPLTITVTPASAASYNNSATVSGKTSETNKANNTASNNSSAAGAPAPADEGLGTVVFTREACTVGQPIVTAPDEVGCHKFIGPMVAAANNTKVYMTYVTGSPQKASAVPYSPTTVDVNVRANCLPYSGVSIAYAGTTLDCKGGWQKISVSVASKQATASLANDSLLTYADVGRISLEISSNGVTGVVNFISRPADIVLSDVLRASDNYPDQMGASTTVNLLKQPIPYAKDDSYAFAKAGEQFILRLGALMADGKLAPSFGKEATALKGTLPDDQLDLDFKLDLFPADASSTKAAPVTNQDDRIGDVARDAFVIDQAFTLNTGITSAGVFDARVRWYEAGYLAITPYLADYLGTGEVGGPPDTNAAGNELQPGDKERMVASTRVVGRFYPDHFETEMIANFPCVADMKCPTAYPVSGATYSQQPFSYAVTAYGLARNNAPTLLSMFRHVSTRSIALAAYSQPNLTTVPAGGVFTPDPDNKLPYSGSATDFPALAGKGSYKLGSPYDAAAKTPTVMTAPTPVYLRASMPEAVMAASGKKTFQVNSIAQGSGQYEDGLEIVAGRLLVSNVFGSELLNLPVPLTAQYWNGSNWVLNKGDSDSKVAPSLAAVKCTKSFAATAAGDCKTGVIAMTGPGAGTGVQVKEGKAGVSLKSPGPRINGSIDFSAVTATSKAPWLPSTIARATFGLFKSPVIYIREVY